MTDDKKTIFLKGKIYFDAVDYSINDLLVSYFYCDMGDLLPYQS